MRRLLTFLVVAAPTLAFASPEVAAVLKVQEEFAASWNKGDYKAMAAVFADDADRINAAGRVAKGKAEIEKLYQEEQTGKMKGTHFASECNDGVRLLKPDVAVVTCSFEVTEMKGPDGKPLPPLKGLYTATMVKSKGKWLIVVGRAMIPFVPPAPPAAK